MNNKSHIILAGLTLVLTLMFLSVLPSFSTATVQTLGIYKQNTNVSLIQTCLTSTSSNITRVVYPNGNLSDTTRIMTKSGNDYSYNWQDTELLGNYLVYGVCDETGVLTAWQYDFIVTGNGRSAPDGVVIVLFAGIFLILLGLSVYLVIYSLGHLMSLDFDMIDLALDIGMFIGYVVLYYLQSYYLGNPQMDSILLTLMPVVGILLVLIPMIAFILSVTIGSLNKKRWQLNHQQTPSRIKFRRSA